MPPMDVRCMIWGVNMLSCKYWPRNILEKQVCDNNFALENSGNLHISIKLLDDIAKSAYFGHVFKRPLCLRELVEPQIRTV